LNGKCTRQEGGEIGGPPAQRPAGSDAGGGGAWVDSREPRLVSAEFIVGMCKKCQMRKVYKSSSLTFAAVFGLKTLVLAGTELAYV
jgi:hypothetical protein